MKEELKVGDKVKMGYNKWTPTMIEKHYVEGEVIDFNLDNKDRPIVVWYNPTDLAGKQVCNAEWLTKI